LTRITVDISKLHNVLRDPTRAAILELVHQRSSLSYVDLQNLLQIAPGKLNYHLRVLGDLLVKDEQTGRYSLGEKGEIAVQLLSKFQTVIDSSEARKSLVTGACWFYL
jgi:DNA-binding transcriptional ArsR family regulator